MQKTQFARYGAAVTALTLIPLTYQLINRPNSIPHAETHTAVDSKTKQQTPHSHCQGCTGHAPHDARQNSSYGTIGLLWETSLPNPAEAAITLEITNGAPLASEYRVGERPQLVLEDGTEVQVEVSSRYVHSDGTVAVDALVPIKQDGAPDGHLHMQWNDQDGFFLGQIEFPNHPLAYEITRQNDGTPVITRRTIDQLLCAEVEPSTMHVRYGMPAVDEALASEWEATSEETTAAEGETTITEEAAMLVPALNSYPSAEAVVYLDFDGEEVKGTSWGSNISAAPTGYSAAKITDIWKRVAADMEPFNLNVTTEEAVYLNAPATRRIRCIITPSNEWYYSPSVGGVAKRSSFTWSGDTPCWAFSDNLLNGTKYIAECCSHEVGHTLGLAHDGKDSTTYYAGHGSGAVGWAPIMGNGYYKTLTQWSKGEYSGATNTQDDLAIIASNTNGFGYRNDDHSSKKQTASVIPRNANDQISATGVIETRGDVDIFELESGSGSVTLEVQPANSIANVDLMVELYDAQGSLISTANPGSLLNASISTQLDSGTYYLHVKATGYGTADTGSSDYASLGAYTIHGQLASDSQPSPYELTVSSLPEEDRDLGDDPDGDGLNNLAEHALGTNPDTLDTIQNFTSIEALGPSAAEFIIDLPAEIPADTIYVVEATCALESNEWTSIAICSDSGQWSGDASVSEEIGPNGKRRFRINDHSGESWTCRFMRVRFELANNS
ncbi:hypothetical protein HW115_09730 [Verrucomicrobiaceae bacterium N1E253]|uniref:Peptidase C-terminal archaeal/bacterial domain-containing protein n=1 Tax=Oceaniferula marina TaxID=2748318 RepID=A0A851GJ42_9BACT|nr:hypothetical protein [Oceaniferula marina]NWK55891.1 hypothetical protein [Oceaniferula marina]